MSVLATLAVWGLPPVLMCALALTFALWTRLYGIAPADTPLLVATALTVRQASRPAAVFPAVRASLVDLVDLLKEDRAEAANRSPQAARAGRLFGTPRLAKLAV